MIGTALSSVSRSGWLVTAATVLLGMSVATAAAVRQDPAAKPAPPPAPPAASAQETAKEEEEFARLGEELTERLCNTQCHGMDKLDMRRTVREWNDVVSQMVNRGVMGTEQQLAIVRQYLKRYYGIIAINTATAEDLSAVLGFSAKDAQAIVEYRTAHGKFADAAALAEVPGIDKMKLEEQPDAIRFR